MCLRYSLKVVAPMHWISPRAKAGFKMLEASIAPSAAPAPTIVWSSSMNKMMFGFFFTSSITALIRSSNWPRYFVPATIKERSKEMIRLFCKSSGTCPRAIIRASPSTTAVLPTPASPMRAALFFRRRQRIMVSHSISCSRPTTGSSSMFFAISVRSYP